MKSIDDKIIAKIKKCGRGKGYFSSDFASYGEGKSISKVLERFQTKENVLRKYISMRPKQADLSDAEIMDVVNSARYST